MPTNILNPEERQQLTSIPTEISEADLARFFTLTVADMELIDLRDEPEQLLDQAAHISLLRWLGWSPVRVDRLPPVALLALCEQLQIQAPDDLSPPAERTSRKHARLAREHLGWRKFTADTERSLTKWLKPRAAERDRSGLLLHALLQHLYREQIVRPGLSWLERLVATVRAAVDDEIAQTVSSQLSEKQKEQLDKLLVVPAGETLSPWQHLKEPPSGASRNVLLDVLQKIESIRALKLDTLDLGKVPPNRIKLLAQQAKRRTNWMTLRLKPERRYLLLVCFLDQALPKMTDIAIDLHNKLIQGIFTGAESRRDEEVAKRGQSLNNKVLLLGRLGHMILDEKSFPDTELRAAIYRRISRDNLTQAVQECDAIAQPADYTSFSYADGSYSHLRVFGPKFLQSIQIQAEEKGRAEAVLEAVKFIQAVNAGERTFEEPPLGFVPWQWKAYVGGEDEAPINHRMYQLCLHKCLVRALENGDLWVPGSREYVSFRHEWIADEAFATNGLLMRLGQLNARPFWSTILIWPMQMSF